MSTQVVTGARTGADTSITTGQEAQHRAALLAALAYADLFDSPLTLEELSRYQVGTRLAPEDIARFLSRDEELRARTSTVEGYYFLRGREATVALRNERKTASDTLWPRARTYAQWLAHLPYVRMVAVTGSLSVDNVSGKPDIDLMVVAEPGRVWICRRLLVVCVRIGRLLGDEICPNFILSTNKLVLDEHDFFTAHELSQMVPLFGREVYDELLEANTWALDYLPQAFASPLSAALPEESSPTRRGKLRKVAERVLRHQAFNVWERKEMLRLRRRLQVGLTGSEVVCSPEQCKGHTGLHKESTMVRYRARLTELGLLDSMLHLFARDESEHFTPATGHEEYHAPAARARREARAI